MSGATALLFSVLVILSQQKGPPEELKKKQLKNLSFLTVGNPFSIITPKGTFTVEPGTKDIEIRVAVGRMVKGIFVQYPGTQEIQASRSEIGPGKFNALSIDYIKDPNWNEIVVRMELWTTDMNSPQLTKRDVSYKTLP